jgi:hypothetical protein
VLDRRQQVALLPLDDEDAALLLASVPESARKECWWLVLRDGRAIPGDGGAGVVLLAEIRLTRPLGRALRTLGASRLVDALDRLVSRHRARLGRLVPDGPAPRRYP